MSSFFKIKDPGTIGSGSSVGYGEVYLSKEQEGWDSAVASVTLRETSQGVGLFGGPIPAGGGSFPGFSPYFSGVSILPNHWYELRVDYEHLGSQIGWEVNVNDYGLDGTTFVGNTLNFVDQTPDSIGLLSDSTLYGGFTVSQGGIAFVDNFSIRDDSLTGSTTISVSPTFDAQHRPGNAFPLGNLTEPLLSIDGGFGTSFPALEVLTEFSLGSVPAGAQIQSAQLLLDPDGIVSGTMNLQAFGYGADGLPALTDPAAATTLFGSLSVAAASSDEIAIPLDAAILNGLLAAEESHVGFLLKSATTGPFFAVHASESTTGMAPRLVLTYASETVAGDYNGDGSVDVADYTVWRDGLGTTYTPTDYNTWVVNFGSGATSATAIPEPASFALLALLGGVLAQRRV
ncbi:hypothetical protein [Botrimarina hoheduenensis]|uniref:hypothetical protein n=1 Tax=Botrimarina hoheduenensis TaxID=2528000 RepID=UPI0011B7DB2B|nr:hypothetical protein [Botrimarina hoheduenensis]